MQITYQLNLNDFVEACNAFNTAQRARGEVPRTRWWAWALLIAVAAFISGCIVWIAVYGPTEPFDAKKTAANTAVIASWCMLMFLQSVVSLSMRHGRAASVWALSTAGVVIALVASFYLWHGPFSVAAVLPWIVISELWLLWWSALVRKTNHQSVWSKLTHLHDAKTLQCTDDGFEIFDALSSERYSWRALRFWIETRELLLLFISESEFRIVPKRAFRDEASTEEFRRALIDATKQQPSRFPVVMDDATTAGNNQLGVERS